MLIRLTANVYGAWSGNPGDEIDRPDAEAKQLVAGGFAVPVDAPAGVTKQETAEAPQ